MNNSATGTNYNFSYVFNYTDHLGNIRLSYSKLADNTMKILEESHYYPFGLKHENYNSDGFVLVPVDPMELNAEMGVMAAAAPEAPQPMHYDYKYNGKEWQDELGLNMYAMDMRQYDPAIGRWIVQDPVVHFGASPYSAYNNNPTYWSDPSGMSGEHYNWDKKIYENDGGHEVSFETAMASQGLNYDGSNKSEEESSSASNEEKQTSDIQFPKNSDYEKSRPQLTKTVKNLHDYVKGNPALLDLLAEYSGFSTMEVLKELQYGKGGTLLTEVLSAEYGQTTSEGIMKVNLKWANGLEIVKQNQNLQATSFLVAITILHEFVHYGRIKNKLGEGPYEYGRGWEQQFFKGQEIDKDNAYKLLQQYGKGWKI